MEAITVEHSRLAALDQRQMSAMQRAHRRDQSDNAVLRARLPRLLLHPRQSCE